MAALLGRIGVPACAMAAKKAAIHIQHASTSLKLRRTGRCTGEDAYTPRLTTIHTETSCSFVYSRSARRRLLITSMECWNCGIGCRAGRTGKRDFVFFPKHKKNTDNTVRVFQISDCLSAYATRLRRNNNADTPIANNAIEVGSGTVTDVMFQGVNAEASGVLPETKDPADTNWLHDIASL